MKAGGAWLCAAAGAALALAGCNKTNERGLEKYALSLCEESTPEGRSVPDLDAARAHLAAHGATVLQPKPWGACDVLEPEGNVFQIALA